MISDGRNRLLVDTGASRLDQQAAMLFPGTDQTSTIPGLLPDSLRLAGVNPASIDMVVIGHAHPDHIGGTLDDHGALIFPNARYLIAREEWHFWLSDQAAARVPASMVGYARRNLAALGGWLSLIDDVEIVPDVRAIAAPGHTPGHVVLEIASGDRLLLHVSDVVLSPLYLEHPGWHPRFDLEPIEAARSKQRIFDRAAATDALVFGHHLAPFPNLGYVRKLVVGWQWLLIDSDAS